MNSRHGLLVLALSLTAGLSGCAAPAEPTKPDGAAAPGDAPPAEPAAPTARTLDEVIDAYIKAADAKDFDTMASLADAPWLDTRREFSRSRERLPRMVERVAGQMTPAAGRKVEKTPYRVIREEVTNAADRTLLDELLRPDDWVVTVTADGAPKRFILVRVRDGVARVVAGPLKLNQFLPKNRVPYTIEYMLDLSDTFELYSLDPTASTADLPPRKVFYGYKVLGKAEVTKADDRARLAEALRRGMDDNEGEVKKGFTPRYALRMSDNTDTVDLLISFEQRQINVYVNGTPRADVLTTDSPAVTFDSFLPKAAVAPSPGK